MAALQHFVVFFLLIFSTVTGSQPCKPSPVIRAAYYPSWKYLHPSSIPFHYFTHIIYGFVQPDSSTASLLIPPSIAGNITALTAAARSQTPAAKILLSIGGGQGNKSSIAALVSSPASRASFINSSIAAARRLCLDGLDFDWEYPVNAKQMSDLGCLFREWRCAVEEESAAYGRPRLLLSAAVYFASKFFLGGEELRDYPIAGMAGSLDWINVMCFDYHAASFEPSATALHAALYSSPGSNVSTSYGIESWVKAGMPREKVVMGIPAYGWTWTLKYRNQTGVGAPAAGVGPGPEGAMTYSEIVEFGGGKKMKEVYDKELGGSYSYAGTAWVGYDGPESVKKKTEFGKKMGIGGYFFLALGYDDKEWTLADEAYRHWIS